MINFEKIHVQKDSFSPMNIKIHPAEVSYIRILLSTVVGRHVAYVPCPEISRYSSVHLASFPFFTAFGMFDLPMKKYGFAGLPGRM